MHVQFLRMLSAIFSILLFATPALAANVTTATATIQGVVGIQGAVDLYELHGETAPPEWLSFRDTYEKDLGLYESRNWLQTQSKP